MPTTSCSTRRSRPSSFKAKTRLGTLMNHVIAGFESWERTFGVADEEQCVFGARGRIAGQTVELAELTRLAPDGRVSENRIHGRRSRVLASGDALITRLAR